MFFCPCHLVSLKSPVSVPQLHIITNYLPTVFIFQVSLTLCWILTLPLMLRFVRSGYCLSVVHSHVLFIVYLSKSRLVSLVFLTSGSAMPFVPYFVTKSSLLWSLHLGPPFAPRSWQKDSPRMDPAELQALESPFAALADCLAVTQFHSSHLFLFHSCTSPLITSPQYLVSRFPSLIAESSPYLSCHVCS